MSESNPERPLDRHLDALIEGGAIRSDAARASIGSAAARSAAMLHRMLEEPPDADTAPDLTPVVMARIERKAAPPAPGASPSLADRFRSALARVALGPVAAAGALAAALAAALAIALFAAGDAPGPLSGAAVGLAAPSLAAVAVVALGIGAAAWWLRRR